MSKQLLKSTIIGLVSTVALPFILLGTVIKFVQASVAVGMELADDLADKLK